MSPDVKVTEDLGNAFVVGKIISLSSRRLLLPSHLAYNLKIALMSSLCHLFLF